MRERDREWLADAMSSSSLRERDEIDAKSTSDINTIEMKKRRSDNDKTVKDLRAKVILIAELYEFRAKEMMNVLDQLIKTSRVTRTNDVSSMFKSTKTIKKLKKMTTRLKKIAKKKKTCQKKSNTWTTIARRDVAMIMSVLSIARVESPENYEGNAVSSRENHRVTIEKTPKKHRVDTVRSRCFLGVFSMVFRFFSWTIRHGFGAVTVT